MYVFSFTSNNIPYIGNHSQKKTFTDFVNLGAFANIFLYFFKMKINNT